jgi:hypothetical protein
VSLTILVESWFRGGELSGEERSIRLIVLLETKEAGLGEAENLRLTAL